MSAFNLQTHLGAFLFRENHFNKNGLVGFVATELLDGYIDASGKEETLADKILTVNGCLSTPQKWQEFDDEWQPYLKSKGFKPDSKTGRYVFHTSPFWVDKCQLMPRNLTRRAKQEIYHHLIDIICKHTVYRFGYGVILDDFRKIEMEFPHVRESLLSKPGTRMSWLCFKWNSVWADNNNYAPSISYMFDRGDKFFGELYNWYRVSLKHMSDDDINVIASLAEGNKAMYSPIQAADIVAWECRKYFLTKLVGGKYDQFASGIRPCFELRQLNVPNVADFRLYDQIALKGDLRDLMNDILRKTKNDVLKDEHNEELIGDGKLFKDIDDFMRNMFQYDKDERVAENKTKQAEAKIKKAKKEASTE